MNRFHVHVSVDDLDKNIAFYSALLGTPPTIVKPDYAKWMLDDPRVNFAISARGAPAGLDHLGIQVENAGDLDGLKARFDAADASAVTTEADTVCCYARSSKHWITDPQGIAWEAFHTLDSAPTFHEAGAICCAPAQASDARAKLAALAVTAGGCCGSDRC